MDKFLPKHGATLAIAILLLVALVLGYSIYAKSPLTLPSNFLKISNPIPSPSSSSRTLTADEKAALKTPAQGSSEEERKKHFDASLRAAKSSSTLNISQCLGDPIVIRLQQNQNLTIQNPDPAPHTIVVDKEHVYNVPANGKSDIKVDFGKGGGLYGYGCDDHRDTRGLFLVSQ